MEQYPKYVKKYDVIVASADEEKALDSGKAEVYVESISADPNDHTKQIEKKAVRPKVPKGQSRIK